MVVKGIDMVVARGYGGRMTIPHKDGRGFRHIPLSSVIVVDRAAARAQILEAFRKAEASLKECAAQLGISGRTLSRYIARLGMSAMIKKRTQDALAEGWLSPTKRVRGVKPEKAA